MKMTKEVGKEIGTLQLKECVQDAIFFTKLINRDDTRFNLSNEQIAQAANELAEGLTFDNATGTAKFGDKVITKLSGFVPYENINQIIKSEFAYEIIGQAKLRHLVK